MSFDSPSSSSLLFGFIQLQFMGLFDFDQQALPSPLLENLLDQYRTSHRLFYASGGYSCKRAHVLLHCVF